MSPIYINGVEQVAAHKTKHQDGGVDEVSVAALSGELADRQLSKVGTSVLGWTDEKLLKGAGAGVAPDEIDVPSADILKTIQQYTAPFWFNCNWAPAGMMESGKSGSGYFEWYTGRVELCTGVTSASYSYVSKYFRGLAPESYTWGKKRYFGISAYFTAYSFQYVHMVSGGITSYTASGNTQYHIGFKLINDSLYGTVGDGTTESTLLLGTLTAAGFCRLECILTPGVECRFYFNGVDIGAITTNLPPVAGDAYATYALWASVYNAEAVGKELWLYVAKILQVE